MFKYAKLESKLTYPENYSTFPLKNVLMVGFESCYQLLKLILMNQNDSSKNKFKNWAILSEYFVIYWYKSCKMNLKSNSHLEIVWHDYLISTSSCKIFVWNTFYIFNRGLAKKWCFSLQSNKLHDLWSIHSFFIYFTRCNLYKKISWDCQ